MVWKIDKYEYLTGEEILPSDESRIIQQVKFTYSPLSKAFERAREKTNRCCYKSKQKTRGFNNTITKDFNDFENGIVLFRKIKSGEMKMQKNCKIYLKQIWMKCRK